MNNVAVVVERDDTGRVSKIPIEPNWPTQVETHGTLKVRKPIKHYQSCAK